MVRVPHFHCQDLMGSIPGEGTGSVGEVGGMDQ